MGKLDFLAAMIREGVDVLIVLADPQLIDLLRGRIVDLAAKHRLPAMYSWKMYLVINLKAARALGLTISPTILFQADEVIQ